MELIKNILFKTGKVRARPLKISILAGLMVIIAVSSMYNFYDNYRANDRSREFDHYLRAKNKVSKVEDDAVIIPEDYFVSMTLLYYIWVQHKENDIIVPFSFIANPYYIDLDYLEKELGIKREPFRMSIEEIDRYIEENNILMKDISEVLKRRPVYHWKPRRVRAQIAICFAAYGLVKHLE